jgi:hypothetical protein
MSIVKSLRIELSKLLESKKNLIYNKSSFNSLQNKINTAQKAKLEFLKDELNRIVEKGYSVKSLNTNFTFNKEIKKEKENILKLDINNVENYNYYTHIKKIKELVKIYPNAVYQQITRYYDGDKLVDMVNITDTDVKQIKDKLKFQLRASSKGAWFVAQFIQNAQILYVNPRVEIITRAYKRIEKIDDELKFLQTFRDNDTGTCVYDAFIKYFSNLTSVRAKQTLKRLQKNEQLYCKAYNYDNLKEICQLCNSSLLIVDLINEKDQLINENPCNFFRLQMINSKYNHLDLFINDFEINPVSNEDYDVIKLATDFYVEKMGTLYTLKKTYKKVDTHFKEIYNEWKKEVNYSKLSMLEDSDEFRFINNYDYSTHRFNTGFVIENELYKEKDLKKAYYNYSDVNYNRFYKGLPCGAFISVFCDDTFDYTKLVDRVGFFEIEIMESNDKLNYFGFTYGSKHILFTATIDLFIEKKINFKFINACYSKKVHIPFSEDLFIKFNKDDYIFQEGDDELFSIKGYCKAYGMMNTSNSEIDITIKPLKDDYNYYSVINNTNNIVYSNDEIIKIKKINQLPMTHKHLFNAIHSYCKTLVLEQLFKMNTYDIVGVKVDSIVFRGDYEFPNNFDNKKCKIEKLLKKERNDSIVYKGYYDENDTSNEYYKTLFTETYNNVIFKNPILYTGEHIYNDVFIGGAGGTGKTTSLLEKINPKTLVFTTICWNLITNVKEKYNCIGLSLPKLTGDMNGKPCDKTNLNIIRNIIIDEATMIDKNIIKTIIDEYYYCNIYVLGDIDKNGRAYQTKISNNILKDFSNFQYVKYTKTYRFDNELNEKLIKLRLKMIEYNNNIPNLENYIKEEFSANYVDKNIVEYNDKSIGISSNNDLGDASVGLTDYFIKKGATEKYYVKTTDLNKKLYRGMKLDEKPDNKNYEMKLFNSIHSYQGQTIEKDENIIISFNKVFEYNLFYTAFSRARTLNQIIILK